MSFQMRGMDVSLPYLNTAYTSTEENIRISVIGMPANHPIGRYANRRNTDQTAEQENTAEKSYWVQGAKPNKIMYVR